MKEEIKSARLITIRFSHYNEKARWVLDHFKIKYDETPTLPILHLPYAYLAARKLGKEDKVSSKFSTPILTVEKRNEKGVEKLTICDSNKICSFVNDTCSKDPSDDLYQRNHQENHQKIKEWEKLFHDRLGPSTRMVAYFYILDDADLSRDIASWNVNWWQSSVWSAFFNTIKNQIKNGLLIDESRLQKRIATIDSIFQKVSQTLDEQKSEYLVGNQFSAADLTFAALSAPILLVSPEEGYGAYLPNMSRVHPDYQTLIKKYRNSPAGQFALRMFKQERGTRIKPCNPPIPSQSTNKFIQSKM